MLDEEPQAISNASASAATNGNGVAVTGPITRDPGLARALNAFYALTVETKAEFMRIVTLENKTDSPEHEFASSAGIFKDDPLWDDIKATMRTYREPEPEGP